MTILFRGFKYKTHTEIREFSNMGEILTVRHQSIHNIYFSYQRHNHLRSIVVLLTLATWQQIAMIL
jgi:hypothetical protein